MELMNTKLDAVNHCLAGIGREPVATLDTVDLDAAMALASINTVALDIQTNGGKGWWFNQEKGWVLTPNETGDVILPNNTLSVLEARCTFFDQGRRLTIRGKRVYDTERHSFDLRPIVSRGGGITFTLLLALPYEDLPPVARSAISWTARRLFCDDTVGDNQQHQRDLTNEQRAMIALEAEEIRVRRHNYLRDNDRVQFNMHRIGGVNNR